MDEELSEIMAKQNSPGDGTIIFARVEDDKDPYKSNPKPFLNIKNYLILLLVIAAIPATVILVQKQQHVETKAEGIVRGTSSDLWADIIIGKPDFSEVNPYTTGANKLWLPHGIIVDRTSFPQKLYVYDAGNNRILGFNLEKCLSSPTNPLNCQADIVIGQPSMFTSACNGDSGFQNYPTRSVASASTLCGLPERANSISESGSGSSMTVDANGNLYVNDAENHRVLKYTQPFNTDSVADEVWGQNDFSGNNCNKGMSLPDATSLCYSWGNSNNWTTGVDVDVAGNVWIADNGNNRVLRFPQGAKTADLVLGQSNFNARDPGSGPNQLRDPAAVRVNSQGWVYVADHANNRVLVFKPPFTSGMNGNLFPTTALPFDRPAGIDFDPTESDSVWITNEGKKTIELWDEKTQTLKKKIGREGDGNLLGDTTGSIGLDSSGNILVATGLGDYNNDVLFFAKGGPTNTPSKQLFGASQGNLPTATGLGTVNGVVAEDNQLIAAGGGRIMFWNNLDSLSIGKPADGVAGGTGNFTDLRHTCCMAAKADKSHHLWVSMQREGDLPDRIEVFQLPLTNGALPIATITLPILLLGGGQLSFTGTYQAFFGLAPTDNADFLWVSHRSTNRVFRIRSPLTNPVVDIVLGQINSDGTQCNRGAPAQSGATLNTLCSPGSLSFDRLGNLYVSDHALEIEGNMRLLVFNKNLFPTNNTSIIWAPSASKIFPNIATWEPAFDSQNRMVVGYNPYWTANPGGGWFPGVYNDPISGSGTPDSFLRDYHSMAFAATFDQNDNLYVGDLNRNRILIWKVPLSISATPTPVENLALNKTASSNRESIGGHEPAKAVDGDKTTAGNNWQTYNPLNPGDFWQVDLGKVVDLGKIVIYPNSGNSVDWCDRFHVDVSTTGVFAGEQTTVVTEINSPHVASIPYTFPTIQARYIRVINDQTQNWVQLQEFEVFAVSYTPTPTPSPTPTPGLGCGQGCNPESGGCASGLVCEGPCTESYCLPTFVCLNPSCPFASDCVCPTPTPTPSPIPSPTPIPEACLTSWETVSSFNVGCNTTIPANFSTNMVRMTMTGGGGDDQNISFYCCGSGGAAWKTSDGFTYPVTNPSDALHVGESRTTSSFGPKTVLSHNFSVGCNDGETMNVMVERCVPPTYTPTPTLPTPTPTPAGDTQPPSAPTNLAAPSSSYNKVNLTWNASVDNVGVTGYWVIRNSATIASAPTNSFSDTTVNPSTAYSYQVIAYDAAGNNSAVSNTLVITTPAAPDTQPPSAPADLAATAVSSSQINLSWIASSDNVGITGYEIYRNSIKMAEVVTNSFGDAGLSPTTTYSYFVKAYDAAGNFSPASNTASATTNPVVTIGNIQGTVYSSTGGVIAGAKVSIFVSGGKKTYLTNSSGSYAILNLSSSTYSLTFQAKGYVNQNVSVVVTSGKTTIQDVTMERKRGGVPL